MRGRRVVAVISVVWLAAVSGFWREFVPLSPTVTVNVGSDRHPLGFLETGELVLARKGSSIVRQGAPALSGPLEFWQFPEGQKSREALEAGDGFQSWMPHTGEFVFLRDGTWIAVDLKTQTLLGGLPATGRIEWYWPVANGRRLLYLDDRTLRLHDFDRAAEIWTASGEYNSGFYAPTPGLVMALPAPPTQRPPGGWPMRMQLLDLETGLPDPRFDRFGLIQLVQASPDKRTLGILTDKDYTVCDAATIEPRWSMPRRTPAELFLFDESGKEVHSNVVDGSGSIQTNRWAVSDGRKLNEHGRGQIENHAARNRIPRTEYAIDQVNEMPAWSRKGNRWLAKTPLTLRLPERIRSLRVVHVPTDRSVGILPERPIPMAAPDGRGFAIVEDSRIDFYSIPPSRNWWWFLQWGVLPVAALTVAAWAGSRLRARRIATRAAGE